MILNKYQVPVHGSTGTGYLVHSVSLYLVRHQHFAAPTLAAVAHKYTDRNSSSPTKFTFYHLLASFVITITLFHSGV